MPYEGVLRTANVTRLVRIPSSGVGSPLPPGTPWAPCLGSTRRLSWPLRQAHPWLRPKLAPHPWGLPWSPPCAGQIWGMLDLGAGVRARRPLSRASVVSLFLQQRAQVSQQELRYLWVLVSLSATEWVQEVLLEGHPSWKYLEEVHTLLLDVKQGLGVSTAGCGRGCVCACVCACG